MLQSDVSMPAQSTSVPIHLSVNIIGSLRIVRGDTVLDANAVGGPKPRQILEILLLHLGNPVSKDRLIELLWNGRPPAEALPTLESYVSVLRRNLQPGSGKSGPLKTATGGYVMDRAQVDLDLDRFDRLLRRANQAEPAAAQELLTEALAMTTAPLLGDELLPGWAEDERQLHATRVLEAKILAAETAAALGKPDESIRWANQVLAADPLNERAWTALILGLEQAGRHAEGLQCYERCRRAMDRELGCAPGPGLKAAYARLLQTTAGGEDDLTDVLSALLVLHGQLSRTAGLIQPLSMPNTPGVGRSLREAGNVINSFLLRAMSAV
ncbi:BTAD domain-containing putative transcriptional regulator [Arthrobacter sp. H5]|uniref:AfsR/SARP family transcriptional regulator n=1 Tax=Arthrobacter sp. H5 TaxID=1267973 RepID=UPI0004BB7C24|nr:BTAD domain-containing putative transcriptional regulator [Arthrobacter sp. H5]